MATLLRSYAYNMSIILILSLRRLLAIRDTLVLSIVCLMVSTAHQLIKLVLYNMDQGAQQLLADTS